MEPYITERDILTQQINNSLYLIGKDPSAIKKYTESLPTRFDEAFQGFKCDSDQVLYPGTVSVNFTNSHGHITAEATFGDNRRWAFDSDFWGFGFGYTGGAGISVWGDGFMAPSEGERMNFEIVPAQAAAGAIQIFLWRDDSPVLGTFIVGAGGAGITGGGGTGVWTRK